MRSHRRAPVVVDEADLLGGPLAPPTPAVLGADAAALTDAGASEDLIDFDTEPGDAQAGVAVAVDDEEESDNDNANEAEGVEADENEDDEDEEDDDEPRNGAPVVPPKDTPPDLLTGVS